MDGMQEEAYDGLLGVAIYYMDDDGIGSRPVTTYSARLEELGLEEDDTGPIETYRRFRAGDVRIDVRSTDPVTYRDRAVIMSAPLGMDENVYDVLPAGVFKDLRKKAVGVQHRDEPEDYMMAPERSWELEL